jgi:Zn-dependent protease with chaperone function
MIQFYAVGNLLQKMASFDLKKSFQNFLATPTMNKVGIEDPMVKEVDRIKNRLVPFADPQISYHVDVYDFPSITNASAELVGNECRIRVYSGLWNSETGLVKREDTEGLAVIIGHEIAHCSNNHSFLKAAYLQQSRQQGLLEIYLHSKIAGLFNYIAGEKVLDEGNIFDFSRSLESEADYLGMVYMAKAQYNPEAAIRVWEKASKKNGRLDETGFFDSHPTSPERIKFIQKNLSEVKAMFKHAQGESP